MISLKELLKLKSEEDKEKYYEITRRIFANIKTPQNFPNLANEYQSVEWLIKNTDVPFEDMEMAGLKVIS
jgi:hypothetical protein